MFGYVKDDIKEFLFLLIFLVYELIKCLVFVREEGIVLGFGLDGKF